MPSKADLPPVPPELADLAMIGAQPIAAAADESYSSFLDGVRRTAEGELKDGEVPYPQPKIRRPRFTRWLISDVREWLIQRAARGSNPQIVAQVTAHAKKASRRAAELRAAAQIVAQDATQANRANRKAAENRATAAAQTAQGGE